MERILISFVGKSDPINSSYDASLLHIVRNYHPSQVYAIITEELSAENNKNFIVKSVESANLGTTLSFINLDTKNNPSEFNVFKVNEIVNMVVQKHASDELIANVSSGTPQMIAALCNDIVTNDRKIKTIQVTDPYYQPGVTRRHREDLTIEEMVNLIDANKNGNGEDERQRCMETNIYSFKMARQKQILKEQVSSFNYFDAVKMVNENSYFGSNKKLFKLVGYAYECSVMKRNVDDEFAHQCGLYRHRNLNYASSVIVDYFLMWDLYYRKKEYASYILRSTPISFELIKNMLMSHVKKHHPQFTLWAKIGKSGYRFANGELKKCLSEMRIPEASIEELARDDTKYIFDGFLADLLMFYASDKKYNIDQSFIKFLDFLMVVKDTRNELAHQIDIDKFKSDKYIADMAHDVRTQFAKILSILLDIGGKNINFRFFDDINNLIFEQISLINER